MKRIFPLLVIMTLLYSLCLPVFAVEETADDSTEDETVTDTVVTETVADGSNVTVNVVMPAATDDTFIEDEISLEEDDLSPVPVVYSTYFLDEAEAVEASLPSVIVELFGEYQPRTQTVTEYLSDGTEVTYQEYVSGLAGLDWHWLASFFIFALALYCIFRVIGGCLKWS